MSNRNRNDTDKRNDNNGLRCARDAEATRVARAGAPVVTAAGGVQDPHPDLDPDVGGPRGAGVEHSPRPGLAVSRLGTGRGALFDSRESLVGSGGETRTSTEVVSGGMLWSGMGIAIPGLQDGVERKRP